MSKKSFLFRFIEPFAFAALLALLWNMYNHYLTEMDIQVFRAPCYTGRIFQDVTSGTTSNGHTFSTYGQLFELGNVVNPTTEDCFSGTIKTKEFNWTFISTNKP